MPLPSLTGQPIRVTLRRSLGPHLAATHIPGRYILLDTAVLKSRGDFERILVHEIFHFVWVRLGNTMRRGWEDLLAKDWQTSGELGFSAEWRKNKLQRADVRSRTPAWRRYACESFCDTAAWLYADVRSHDEFTLVRTSRARRRAWFREYITSCRVSI